jgi:hypothetical protein
MARLTDANLLFAGSEPKFKEELTKTELAATLNWYSQNKTNKDSIRYASDYLKKKLKTPTTDAALKKAGSTFGFVCRILSNGGTLSEKDKVWFEEQIGIIKENSKPKKVTVATKVTTPTVSIQDRMAEKTSECIGELEGLIDDLILSEFKSNVSPYGLMHTMAIKGPLTKRIVEWARSRRQEFDEALTTTDKDLKEGWSNFTKPQMKKLVAFCDQVILDCQKISEASVKSRKPRKTKEKTPEQLVAKVKICEEFKELGLKSVDVRQVLGATQVWVYNTKYRKLGVYQSEDAGGFSVKGTSLQNFSEAKSIQKKLRKPEVSLPELMVAGKVTLRTFMSTIRAIESTLNGRMSADTVLLRVIK